MLVSAPVVVTGTPDTPTRTVRAPCARHHMLSYRHAFHAGNHADVLKHMVLVALLDHLNQKDKPYWIVDTHAGAGCYALDSGHALQNAEHQGGVSRLWASNQALPPLLSRYLEVVRMFNEGDELSIYPGSPSIAMALSRDEDRLRLFELHPTDLVALRGLFGSAGKRVQIRAEDGLAGLKACVPPPTRRGLVLIDPSYEVKTDYRQVVDALDDAHRRFAAGIYMLWFPLLARAELRRMRERLQALDVPSWLEVSLQVRKPARDGFGMHGSGLFIINPPWTLPAALQAALPVLSGLLGEDEGASHTLDYRIP